MGIAEINLNDGRDVAVWRVMPLPEFALCLGGQDKLWHPIDAKAAKDA